MVAIKLAGFTGEQPRLIPRLLPDSGAQSAINVRLDDGGLTPVRESVRVGGIADPTHQTIYRHINEWFSWPGLVHAAPGPVATDRLYFTGDGAPKVYIDGTTYALAVPRPTGALTAALAGTGTGDTKTRVYVYTNVTEFGEESEPSPASNEVAWKPGNTVDLSGFALPPAGRGIAKQRLYRTQTAASAGTYLYFVAERNVSASDYADSIAVNAFNEPLPSADWNAPPEALQGLTAMANGIMAGFVGKDLYFCEPFHPHAWPEKYSLSMDYEIVALAASGTSLMVVTKGTPYLVAGAHPDSMQQLKLPANLPCINARGCVDLGFAFCYPSHEGLVALRADGSAGIVSGSLFNREEWLELDPFSITAGQQSGRYVLFYDTVDTTGQRQAGAIYIDVGQQPFLIRSSAIASASFYDVTSSELIYLSSGTTDLMQMDPTYTGRASMYWKSKEFILNTPINMGVILIEADKRLTGDEQAISEAAYNEALAANQAILDEGLHLGAINETAVNDLTFGGDALQDLPDITGGLTVGVIADGVRVAQIVVTGRPVRLPGGYRASKWEVDVSGTEKLAQIILATSMDELRAVQ